MITGIVYLTEAGLETGPFNLYSDVDGYIVPFRSGLTQAELLASVPVDNIPDSTTTIRIQSLSETCTNYIDVLL